MLLVSSPKYRWVILSKTVPAMSITTAKDRLKEYGGDPRTFRVEKFSKSGALFSFVAGTQIHWFSTEGGYLQITAETGTSQDEIVSLRSRIRHRFK